MQSHAWTHIEDSWTTLYCKGALHNSFGINEPSRSLLHHRKTCSPAALGTASSQCLQFACTEIKQPKINTAKAQERSRLPSSYVQFSSFNLCVSWEFFYTLSRPALKQYPCARTEHLIYQRPVHCFNNKIQTRIEYNSCYVLCTCNGTGTWHEQSWANLNGFLEPGERGEKRRPRVRAADRHHDALVDGVRTAELLEQLRDLFLTFLAQHIARPKRAHYKLNVKHRKCRNWVENVRCVYTYNKIIYRYNPSVCEHTTFEFNVWSLRGLIWALQTTASLKGTANSVICFKLLGTIPTVWSHQSSEGRSEIWGTRPRTRYSADWWFKACTYLLNKILKLA